MKHIGATLRSIIENNHLQKNTVAETVGITPTYLSNIFNKNTIDCELLDKLSKAVGVPAAYFFDDELPVGRCNTIENIKAALMGPTAGTFDSLFFNCIRIIAAGIAIGLNSTGNVLGSVLFILLYGVTQSICKVLFVNWGYIYGTSFIDMVFSSGLMSALTKASSVLGLMMVGAMTAGMVNVPLNWVLTVGQASVNIGDVCNSIFPGLLGMGLLFFLVSLIKKGVRPVQLIIGILVFALVGALVGIF
mgnify:CR=1 FL=1